jgi:hypothetical protein
LQIACQSILELLAANAPEFQVGRFLGMGYRVCAMLKPNIVKVMTEPDHQRRRDAAGIAEVSINSVVCRLRRRQAGLGW